MCNHIKSCSVRVNRHFAFSKIPILFTYLIFHKKLSQESKMGVFPCGLCPKTFPFEKRLRDHLGSVHGIKKAYLVNRKIAEWKEESLIPSEQTPVELKECCYCKKGFNPKNLAAHKRKCPQREEVANVPTGTEAADAAPEPEGALAANGGVQGTQGGAGTAPGGVEAADTASEPQDAMPVNKEGYKVGFHQFLVSRNVSLRFTKEYMALFNQWLELCGEIDSDGKVLINKFPQFVDQLSNDWQKQVALRMYSQYSCYASGLDGSGLRGRIDFTLVDGKAVRVEEGKVFISRPRVLPSLQEGDSQHLGKKCRDRKKTEPYNIPKPVKAVKNQRARPSNPLAPVPVDEQPSTSAAKGPQASTSQGLGEQQEPDIVRTGLARNDGEVNIVSNGAPYPMDRVKVVLVRPDWYDEERKPHWNGDECGKGKGKGKGKGGKGKMSKANTDKESSSEDSV